MLAWLLVALWVGLCTPNAAKASPKDLGLWGAVVEEDAADPSHSVEVTDGISDVLTALATEIIMDAPSVSLLREVREACLELNLARLYLMMPQIEPGTDPVERYVDLQGVVAPRTSYSFTLFPKQPSPPHPGRLEAQLRVAPSANATDGARAFVFRPTIELLMGVFDHMDLIRMFEGLLVELEEAARVPLSPDAASEVAQWAPQLVSDTEKRLFGAFLRAVPTLVETVAPYLEVRSIGAWEAGGLSLNLDMRTDLDGLRRAGHTELANYMKKLGNLIEFKILAKDGKGNDLVLLTADTSTPSVQLRVHSQQGAVVPRINGRLRPEHSVRLTDPKVDLLLSVGLIAREEGIVLELRNLTVPMRYRQGADQATIDLELVHEPELVLSGQSALTGWIVELADAALDLEAHGQVVFEALARGPDGRGSTTQLRYGNDRESGGSAIGLDMDILVVDNALIRFAFQVVGRHLVPSDAVVSDAMKVLSDVILAIEADYRAVRPALVAK